ncbi:MAG: DUF998 domain-containing protein [Microthrixaceae bacterium]
MTDPQASPPTIDEGLKVTGPGWFRSAFGASPAGEAATRRRAIGGLVGPAAFIGAWATGTVVLDGYSPVPDAISRLAAVGADTRWLMTAGFLGFTAASIPAAAAIRRAVPGSAWTGVLGTGLATAVVAALPLDRSDAVDAAHGVAAAVGYVLFIYGAAAAAGPLHRANHRALAVSRWQLRSSPPPRWPPPRSSRRAAYSSGSG